MSMNVVVLTGRLTRDPELKYGQSGTAYCRFSLAVNRAFDKDNTDFINCVCFGKTAELVGEYLRKGKMVGATGRLQSSSYEVEGQKRSRLDVIVDRIEFLEPRNSTSNNFDNSDVFDNIKESKENYKELESSKDVEEDDDFPF